jgi:hypothetical protein
MVLFAKTRNHLEDSALSSLRLRLHARCGSSAAPSTISFLSLMGRFIQFLSAVERAICENISNRYFRPVQVSQKITASNTVQPRAEIMFLPFYSQKVIFIFLIEVEIQFFGTFYFGCLHKSHTMATTVSKEQVATILSEIGERLHATIQANAQGTFDQFSAFFVVCFQFCTSVEMFVL